MKLKWLIVFVCAVLISLTSYAAGQGKVIFSKATSSGDSAPSDVYEKDLDSGKTKLLISHQSLPKTFRTFITQVTPSQDGKYIAFHECSGVIIKDKKTGATRKEFGGSISSYGHEVISKRFPARDWCFDRQSGRFNMIGSFREESEKTWANGLLLIKPDEPTTERLTIYSPKAKRTILSKSFPRLQSAFWASKDEGVVIVNAGRDEKKGSSVSLLSLNGKQRTLFRWPKSIGAIAQSPDVSTFAIFDRVGIFLVSRTGSKLKTLNIPVEKDNFNVSFQFSHKGKELAVFTSYDYGEPLINWDDKLWIVDLTTLQATPEAKWSETFAPYDPPTPYRRLLCWMPDDKMILILGNIIYFPEDGNGSEGDWYKLWSYDPTRPFVENEDHGQLLFDSSKGCRGLAWIP
jgi:hypothetical protein